MTEPNVEAEDVAQERPSGNEKPWKAYPPEIYRRTVAELVHFSSKTVNSNAALVGVRLSPDDALDAPYVSARTLMARGVSLSLDYGKGGAPPRSPACRCPPPPRPRNTRSSRRP